jgi:predicted alpha/beta superfamily hydrolase
MRTKIHLSLIPPLIYFLLVSTPPGWSQNYVIQSDSLYSAHLKEVRQIQVILPKEYNSSSKDRLDVFYVLDGEWNTPLSEIVYGFLEWNKFVPTNMMIVSIPNKYKNEINMRGRDFTPTRIENYKISGGANNFLLFSKGRADTSYK